MGRDDRPDVDRAVDWTERFLSEAFASGDLSAATYRRLLTRLEVRRVHVQPPVPVTVGAPESGSPPSDPADARVSAGPSSFGPRPPTPAGRQGAGTT